MYCETAQQTWETEVMEEDGGQERKIRSLRCNG